MWYIEFLLFNWRAIKLKEDLEAEDLNDLIVLEKKLQDLINNGFITKEELDLLKQIINCKSIYTLAKEINTDYRTLQVFLNSITNKLGTVLGDTFTDEYWISHMADKYNLNTEEVNKLKDHLSKPYRGE
jgi:bifunctional N-acetylglucosamine-1-phosphate-uridyltransferase/glucosamine-1-phosphate-acetyltransferase GlmU-like protein